MSNQIPTSFVKQFSSNIYHLSQQVDSRVWQLISRKEVMNSDEAYFDRIGLVEAVEKVGRHSDVVFQDTPYSRRRLSMRDYFWADLVDKEDKLRIIHNPESEYAKAARSAMARKMDDIAIAALIGTVYTGVAGATPVVLPDAQKLAASDGTNFSQLNVLTLRNVKYKFDAAEVPENERHFLIGALELKSLLGDTNITSSDYNTVKALVNGEVDSFMGFKFHRLERLPFTTASTTITAATGVVGAGSDSAASGSKRCIAFQASGALCGIGANPTAKVTERADKHYANQVYMSMSLGAMRMEEAKVIEVLTKQA